MIGKETEISEDVKRKLDRIKGIIPPFPLSEKVKRQLEIIRSIIQG